MKPKYLGLFSLILLLVLFLRPIATLFSTVFLILQIFPQMPIRPLTWVTKPPVAETAEFEYNSYQAEVKLFRPNDAGKHPALILSLALKSTPKDEAQIDNFAENAARLGFIVLVPHSKEVQEGEAKIEDKDTFIGAFQFLTEMPRVDKRKISYLGISAGSSLALKAAQDEKIAQKARAVIFFGGYFEAKDYFSSLITNRAAYKEEKFAWQPAPGAIWHAKELIINLVPEEEQPLLESILLEGKSVFPETESQLSKESKFAILAFAAKSPEELEDIWQTAPSKVVEQLGRLSPSQGIENLKARLFILHDRGDRYVPYTESRKLKEALPKEVPTTYLEVSLFEHVQPKGGFSPATLWDLVRLYLFVYQAILFLS